MGPTIRAVTFCLNSGVAIYRVQTVFRREFGSVVVFKTKQGNSVGDVNGENVN